MRVSRGFTIEGRMEFFLITLYSGLGKLTPFHNSGLQGLYANET